MRIATALAVGFYLGYKTHRITTYVQSGKFVRDVEMSLKETFPDNNVITTCTQE